MIPLRALLLATLLLTLIGCEGTTAPPPAATRTQPTPAALSTSDLLPNTLNGTLLALEQRAYPDLRISRTNLATLETDAVLNVPENGWINQMGLSADGETLALAYTPPSPQGRLRLDRSGLFLLDMTTPTATLDPLLVPNEPNTYYYTPVWSPSKSHVFYGQTVIQGNSISDLDVTLMRLDLETMETVPIVKDGIWPRVSPDGTKLAYIQVDPQTLERGLAISDLDGGNVRMLVEIGTYFDIDTPLFSADSQTVYFTVARENPASSRGWVDWLTGVRVAEAHANHNVPSAWWRIGVDGDGLEVISAETDIILHGDIDLTTGHLYFSTVTGLYVYDPATDTTTRIASADHFRTIALRR